MSADLDTQRVREALDCRVLAEEYGVKFRNRSGGWWLAHCFNAEAHAHGDRNPSLSIGQHGYKCFSTNCAMSGDVYSLIATFEELDLHTEFERVLEIAAQRAGIDSAPTRAEHRSRRTHSSPKTATSTSFGTPRPAAKSAHHSPQPTRRPVSSSRRGGHRGRPDTARPPMLARHFPDAWDQPFALDPRHVRLEIMRQIWEVVEPLDLTGQACRWLEGRGIRPEIAHAHGCRDWMPAADTLQEIFARYAVDDLIASGLMREDAQTKGGFKEWCGVRDLRGEGWARGLGVPIVHPGWPVAPIAWRWRLYDPFEGRSGQTFKALAQYGGDPSLPMFPLGVAPPGRKALRDVAMWPQRVPQDQDPRYVVVISEGEPDWLSVADVAAALETDLYVVSVGIVAMSQGYPPAFSGLLDKSERIVCVMDRGRPTADGTKTGGEKVVDGIVGTLLWEGKQRGEHFDACFERVQRKVVRALQPDDRDINDVHQSGALKALLLDHIGDVL